MPPKSTDLRPALLPICVVCKSPIKEQPIRSGGAGYHPKCHVAERRKK